MTTMLAAPAKGRHSSVMIRKRVVAPGEVELASTAVLQFIGSLAMLFAPPDLLAGNGTAMMTLASMPDYTFYARFFWAALFFHCGYLLVRAIRRPSPHTRKWAWQVVIPVWCMWLTGLSFPLIVDQPTNIIMLSAVAVLVTQWVVTRFLVPLDGSWYDREVLKSR